ncbi:TetR family transcriptional regulator [Canicola haemoglobinophilus]|nr:TetR/AcrR family transcriptional regulator [Canicola haemoglobinophilus]OOR98209.1 TetR family transcriptional regulator [Canicola haemoglobinophilus]
MRQSELDMTEQVFIATERLMAEGGLHSLSMHKIAKEAKISPGTIYLYFKNKDELLEQLARRVFNLFSVAMEKDYDEKLSYFEQYRQMWWNIWHYLHENPMILLNVSQYQALPGFSQICQEKEGQGRWSAFCQKAINDKAIIDLPTKVLFTLGLESAINLAFNQMMFKTELSNQVLETAVQRSWRAIQF